MQAGQSPFSAIIVANGQVLARGVNQTRSGKNPTLHAEMVAIAEACKAHGMEALAGSTAICSCEPCPMCLMALYYSGVASVLFGASLQDAIANGSGDPPIPSKTLIELGDLPIEIDQVGDEGAEAIIRLFRQKIERDGEL